MSQVHGSPHAPSARERLVLPLDVTDLATARRWIDQLAGEVGVFKVGLELFTAAGPDAVRAVHDAGAACFLDLKLHDIPATMAKATASAARLGVRFLTVHAVAGPAALRAVAAEAGDTTLLAVTVLTSMDDDELESVGLVGPCRPRGRALGRAERGRRCGRPGVLAARGSHAARAAGHGAHPDGAGSAAGGRGAR
jgi:orotidine 5'-phosphate decarboxylase subfamily 1